MYGYIKEAKTSLKFQAIAEKTTYFRKDFFDADDSYFIHYFAIYKSPAVPVFPRCGMRPGTGNILGLFTCQSLGGETPQCMSSRHDTTWRRGCCRVETQFISDVGGVGGGMRIGGGKVDDRWPLGWAPDRAGPARHHRGTDTGSPGRCDRRSPSTLPYLACIGLRHVRDWTGLERRRAVIERPAYARSTREWNPSSSDA